MSDGVPVIGGVFLDDKGPYDFLLDTGSQSNELDAGVAAKLGIKITRQFILNTPARQSNVGGGRVGSVAVGSMRANEQEFLFGDLAGVREHHPGVVGILGQEFLGKFDYILDFHHGRMEVSDPPSTGMRVPIRMIEGRIAVSTSLGYLVLDSGAETVLVFRLSPSPTSGGVVTAEGSFLRVSTQIGRALQIGDRMYLLEKANYAQVNGAEENGLLPASMFHAIYVCNSKGYLLIDPKIAKE